MSKLPTQLKWSDFVRALKRLNYDQLPSRSGSARHFERLSDGEIVTFHEPHGGDTLRQGTLSEYLRKLGLTREEFLKALAGERAASPPQKEARYRRSLLADGSIVSNCNHCFEVVAKSKVEAEVIVAEQTHRCDPATH